MKRVVGILIITVIALIGYSCRKDVTVEPPPSLTGDYEGDYCIKSGDTPEQCQAITFRFTSERFLMKLDTLLMKEPERMYCDASGSYEMGANVTLAATSSQDSNLTAKVCNTVLGPFGSYALDQSTTGVVVLSNKVGDVTRTLTLRLTTE